jgi:3-deoxy-D-arabino-heptulosonate 7-phosphate (DAHP) synthase
MMRRERYSAVIRIILNGVSGNQVVVVGPCIIADQNASRIASTRLLDTIE